MNSANSEFINSPVNTVFVIGKVLDNDNNKNFKLKSFIKSFDIEAVSDSQSSNINLNATSSIPFIDDNTAINRIYGTSGSFVVV